jgi:SNF2 family DNA or RNA helicase
VVSQSRSECAQYLANCTPKLRYLSKILLETVVKGKRRLLVFANWPMVGWHVEMFVHLLGFRVLSLRSKHTDEMKTATIAKFNNPDCPVDVLVSTYNTCSIGVNLHRACHDLVMIEPAVNANMQLQTIGRVHRIGQRHVQNVHILFQDHTFNRYLEWRCAQKMIAQISGQGRKAYPELDVASSRSDDESDLDDEADLALGHSADAMYRQLFGQSRTRLQWNDPAQLYDEDPGQRSLEAIVAEEGAPRRTRRETRSGQYASQGKAVG